ncbi:MAG: hypothetical protein Fues2KO_40220 [Fuerstiella sp.]
MRSVIAVLQVLGVGLLLTGAIAPVVAQDVSQLQLAVSAVPDDLESDRVRAEKAIESYARREEGLLKQIETELGRLESRLKADRQLNDPQKAAYQAEIDSVRRWLNSGGSLASAEVTLPVITDAAKKSVQLRRSLNRSMANLIRRLESQDLIGLATRIREKTMLVGGALNAHNSFTPGMTFKGYRQEQGQSTQKTLRLTIGTKEGNREFGKVEAGWQYAGHPHHELLWTIEGLPFKATTGKNMTKGNGIDQPLTYEGLFIGNVIVGKYAGKSLRGKPVNGTFRVEVE